MKQVFVILILFLTSSASAAQNLVDTSYYDLNMAQSEFPCWYYFDSIDSATCKIEPLNDSDYVKTLNAEINDMENLIRLTITTISTSSNGKVNELLRKQLTTISDSRKALLLSFGSVEQGSARGYLGLAYYRDITKMVLLQLLPLKSP